MPAKTNARGTVMYERSVRGFFSRSLRVRLSAGGIAIG